MSKNKIVVIVLFILVGILLSYFVGGKLYYDYKLDLKKEYNYGYSNSTVDTIVALFNQIVACDPNGVPYPGTEGRINIVALECFTQENAEP